MTRRTTQATTSTICRTGAAGATVSYFVVDDGGFSRDPETDLNWSEHSLAAGVGDELRWGDRKSRRACARLLLRHRLDRDPSRDELQLFLDKVGRTWEDGYPWTVHVGELTRLGL